MYHARCPGNQELSSGGKCNANAQFAVRQRGLPWRQSRCGRVGNGRKPSFGRRRGKAIAPKQAVPRLASSLPIFNPSGQTSERCLRRAWIISKVGSFRGTAHFEARPASVEGSFSAGAPCEEGVRRRNIIRIPATSWRNPSPCPNACYARIPLQRLEPMRTMVAPSAIACGKSPLMPIESSSSCSAAPKRCCIRSRNCRTWANSPRTSLASA